MLWNWRTGEAQAVLQGHQGWVASLAISPDGTRLASGGNDGTIKFWNLATRQPPWPHARAAGRAAWR